MTFLDRLIRRLTQGNEPQPVLAAPDEARALAALLMHVARVDGTLAPAERRQLVEALAQRFSLPATEAERLAEAGDEIAMRGEGLDGLATILGGEPAREERVHLLSLAFSVAAADGTLHELEDDWSHRLGQILGLTEAEIAMARAEAER
jgi:uncharacterized tellurite resistance protein B-like protein